MQVFFYWKLLKNLIGQAYILIYFRFAMYGGVARTRFVP